MCKLAPSLRTVFSATCDCLGFDVVTAQRGFLSLDFLIDCSFVCPLSAVHKLSLYFLAFRDSLTLKEKWMVIWEWLFEETLKVFNGCGNDSLTIFIFSQEILALFTFLSLCAYTFPRPRCKWVKCLFTRNTFGVQYKKRKNTKRKFVS